MAEQLTHTPPDDRKIGFIVDTCCDVPPEYLQTHPCYLVPVGVNYSDGSCYLDRIDITPEEVYARFAEEIPRTSSPTPQLVHDAFDQAIAEGCENIVCVTISSGLSSTHDLIQSVAASYAEKVRHVDVIDTLNIGFGAGITAMRAMDLYDAGEPYRSIVHRTRAAAQGTHVFFLVDTLEYLYKGGRINKAVYSLGTLLNVRPVLTCDKLGKYVVAAKARGRKASISKALQLVRGLVDKRPFRIGVVQGDAPDELKKFIARVREEFPDAKQVIDGGTVSPALVVHTGPGLLGITIQSFDDAHTPPIPLPQVALGA